MGVFTFEIKHGKIRVFLGENKVIFYCIDLIFNKEVSGYEKTI